MRTAFCNEIFCDEAAAAGEPWPWPRQCEYLARLGYDGIEVAPFTLGSTPLSTPAADRREMRRVAESAGLEIVGLHWLLAKTDGYHLTTADAGVRARTGEYLRGLAELCADLGGRVLVLGSPQQRSLEPGMTTETAMDNAAEVIGSAVARMEELGVVLCLEPLAPSETDFLNTCEEAARLIGRFDSPAVRLHQDVKAMLSEPTEVVDLIRRYADLTAHFHANDGNLQGPGMGDTDFGPILEALGETDYAGFVSVEVFDYEPGIEATAEASLACLKGGGNVA